MNSLLLPLKTHLEYKLGMTIDQPKSKKIRQIESFISHILQNQVNLTIYFQKIVFSQKKILLDFLRENSKQQKEVAV